MAEASRVAPEYSFRFAAADFRRTYGSAEVAFSKGDFLLAAQMASPGSELKGCSLILGGLNEQGLNILNQIPGLTSRAQLCRSFALWSLDCPGDALSAISNVSGNDLEDSFAKFRTLLSRDNINVFITGAILSFFPEHYSETFIAPVCRYGSITAKYVASQFEKNSYEYDPADPFDKFVTSLPKLEKPDLIFSLSPQWLLAKDFHKVDVPKVIWAHDSDAFQYRNVDNFSLYDVAICNCSQEHFELSQGTPALFGAANMLLHPLATPFPEARPDSEKKFDILFTGSAMAPFHSEKPRFLFNMAELATKYNVRIVEGHMPERDYFDLISHSKFLPIVNRYAGMPSPRWRDALANGAFLLYPEGSFYSEIAPGCFPYRPETLVDDIGNHVMATYEGNDPAYEFSKVVPEINTRFSIHRQPREKSFERLLKYALFFGLVWPRKSPAKDQRQRRLVWLTPAVDCGLFGAENVRRKISSLAESINEDDLSDDIGYSNAAHLNAQLVFMFREHTNVPEWSREVERYFRQGLAIYPDSLLLQFNAAHWACFRPGADMRRVPSAFRDVIEKFGSLKFSPEGADVAFAYTLHDNDPVFPCYEYADVATSEMVLSRTPVLQSFKEVKYSTRQIILSACHGYIGWALDRRGRQSEALEELERAIRIYPLGLPILRLYLDALLKRFLEQRGSRTLPSSLVGKIADTFFAIVNINPSILLTDSLAVGALLAESGEEESAKNLIAAWYRLANIVHQVGGHDSAQKVKWFDTLWNYRRLLPETLRIKITKALSSPLESTEFTQLELGLLRSAKRDADIRRLAARNKFSLNSIWSFRILKVRYASVDDLVKGLLDSRTGRGSLWRAFGFWLGAPPEVRRLYVLKALQIIRSSDIRGLMLKIHQWSVYSKWSKGAGLKPPQK